MGRARQTFERRQLGLTLRRLRDQAGLTQHAAAEAIGRVRSRIVELEEGKGTLNQEDLGRLLDCYGIVGADRATVLALGGEARKRQRSRLHTDLLPGSLQRYADLEASASEINNFESGLVPGLLQSPGYVEAIMNEGDGIWWKPSETELNERIAFRLDRQSRAWGSQQPQAARFVVAEEALRATVKDSAVMREQLHHILALDAGRPELTLQVLPLGTPANPARGGSFAVFRFSGMAPPVGVSTVAFGPDMYFDDPTETAALLRAFDRLSELALTPKESRQLIEAIVKVT